MEVPIQKMSNPRTGIRTKRLVDEESNKVRIRAFGHGHILTVPYQDYLTSSENHKWAEKAFFDRYKDQLPSWVQSARLELYKGLKQQRKENMFH